MFIHTYDQTCKGSFAEGVRRPYPYNVQPVAISCEFTKSPTISSNLLDLLQHTSFWNRNPMSKNMTTVTSILSFLISLSGFSWLRLSSLIRFSRKTHWVSRAYHHTFWLRICNGLPDARRKPMESQAAVTTTTLSTSPTYLRGSPRPTSRRPHDVILMLWFEFAADRRFPDIWIWSRRTFRTTAGVRHISASLSKTASYALRPGVLAWESTQMAAAPGCQGRPLRFSSQCCALKSDCTLSFTFLRISSGFERCAPIRTLLVSVVNYQLWFRT